MYKERKPINVINGSHYYNKEMITEFLITVSLSSGSFRLEQTGKQMRVITSLPPPWNPKKKDGQMLASGYSCPTHLERLNLVVLWVKNPPTSSGDIRVVASIPGSGRGGHGNPLQHSCLENPMDKGTWQATVHGLAKSRTRLKWLSMHSRVMPGYLAGTGKGTGLEAVIKG